MRTNLIIGLATVALFSTSAMAASISTVGESNAIKTSQPNSTFIMHSGPEAVVGYDVAGTPSWDLFGDSSNASPSWDIAAALGAPSGSQVTVSGFGWDVTVTANDPSWLSEIAVGMTTAPGLDTGLFFHPGSQNNPGTEVSNSGGMFDLTDNGIPDLVLPNGVLNFQFYEDFDDGDDAVDGVWNSGSLLFEATAVNVPEPTTLGVLALGSLLSLRRARRA